MQGEDERKEDNSAAGEEETTFSNTEVSCYVFLLNKNLAYLEFCKQVTLKPHFRTLLPRLETFSSILGVSKRAKVLFQKKVSERLP